ncbi:MAG: hypothetical protein GY928_07325 [Colwellia sp.]|nr:hypothetical protein [Colwellia sp.]
MEIKPGIFFMFVAIAVIIAIIVIVIIFVALSQNNKQTKLETQVLVPQEDLEILKTKSVIGFRVSGKLFQQISDWEYSIDEMVFKEQLDTGSFRGKYSVDGDLLKIMQQVEKEGGILPYYGVGGSSGASVYHFKPTTSGITVRVEHSVTEEFLDINVANENIGAFVDRETNPKFKYSAMPFLVDEELPEAWNKTPANEMIFRVVGKEYQNLADWENWADEQAFTSKYVYRFGLVSMGSGFTIKVEDTETGSTIDATDYDNW